MARIAGVDIPPQKRTVIALTYIHGIGDTTAQKILKMANIDPEKRTRDLPEDEVARLRQVIDRLATAKDIVIEGDLRREVATNIKRLTEIGSYRGQRHRRGLPVRGQRTRTNARSRRGPKRAVAGKKKVKAYSFGMKQRLGLALALMRPRQLLVLDEPTNGMDPQGTREIRNLTRELATEGATVFLSSHLLAEVEQVRIEETMMNSFEYAGGRELGPAAVLKRARG